MISTARGLLAIAAAAIVALFAVDEARAETVKTAGRVYLSSGDVLAVAFTTTGNPNREDSTLIVRDETTGMAVTVVDKLDHAMHRHEMTISSGKQTIQSWEWLGFSKDGLPVPTEVRIGQKTYRALTSNAHPNPPELERIKDAVRALPADFVALLQKLSVLDYPNFTSYAMLAFDTINEWTGVQKQPITITQTVKLQPAEIEGLIRESASR